MTKNELIVKQQLKLEEIKSSRKKNKEVLKKIHGKFYGIGQPLNGDTLNFNAKQLEWVWELYELTQEL